MIVARCAGNKLNCRLAIGIFAFIVAAQTTVDADDDEDVGKERIYSAGPLTQKDYQAEPPENRRTSAAWTTTDLRFDFRYEYKTRGARYYLKLKAITIEATVDPNRSWNTRPNDVRLMDHEQGHFDLTYIASLKAQVLFAEQMSKGSGIRAEAASEREASKLLRKEVQRQLGKIFTQLYDKQKEYDAETKHGIDPKAQAEHREQHETEIEEWTRKLRDLQSE